MSSPLSCTEAERPAPPTIARRSAAAVVGESPGSSLDSKVSRKGKAEVESITHRRREVADDKNPTNRRKSGNNNNSSSTTNGSRRSSGSSSSITTKRQRSGDGFCAGLLAIGIYALMHDSGIMTILLLAFVWWYSLEESHQRIFLFFLVLLNFAEYFYLLPPVLARYQQEDWWDIPTIKTALLTMSIFWSIAWFSAATGSYLENKEQKLRLEREKKRLEQIAFFQQQPSTTDASSSAASTTPVSPNNGNDKDESH